MKGDDSYLLSILDYAKMPPSKISIETFQGIVILTIMDTKIFPKNIDLMVFIGNIFNLKFKDYVYRSRTLVIARVIREINKLKKDEFHTLKVKFFKHFKDLSGIKDEGSLSQWLQGLGSD